MILSAQSISQRYTMIDPMAPRTSAFGMTYGIGPAGYDVRIAETIDLRPGKFTLASTIERFKMPTDLLAVVHDKSTWARRGLSLFNTVIEPGWQGFLTLELSNHGRDTIELQAGMPIAQVIFHVLDNPTVRPYQGRYQNQSQGPQPAILGDDQS